MLKAQISNRICYVSKYL